MLLPVGDEYSKLLSPQFSVRLFLLLLDHAIGDRWQICPQKEGSRFILVAALLAREEAVQLPAAAWLIEVRTDLTDKSRCAIMVEQ